jgi:hypothetical protein
MESQLGMQFGESPVSATAGAAIEPLTLDFQAAACIAPTDGQPSLELGFGGARPADRSQEGSDASGQG